MTRVKCPQCGVAFDAIAGRVNRAHKIGAPLYCGKACAGVARRREVQLSEAELKERKRLYDANRRAEKRDELKAKQRDHYYANRDRIIAWQTVYRAKHMQLHVEYCRQPEYRAYKHEYDRRRGEQKYAEWAETWRLLLDLEKEIRSQATAYERRVANGYYTRNAQKRRRELWQLTKNLNSTPATSSRNSGTR